MKKKIFILFFALPLLFQLKNIVLPVYAEEPDVQSEYSTVIDEQIDAIDETEFSKILETLTEEQRALFGGADWKTIIKQITEGDFLLSFENFGELILSVLKENASKYVVLIASIIGICILTSLIHSARSGFLEDGVGEIIFYAGFGLVLTLVLVACFTAISAAESSIQGFQAQMTALLPVMLVLLAGAGGEISAGVFSPATAFLSSGILGVFLQIAFPLLYAMIALSVIGNISSKIKTGASFSLLGNICKWVLGTCLAVYSLVLGMQGITAAAHDGISYKLLKYTVGNSIPIVGGTIKDGFDLLLASCITVKNAVGYFALLLLIGAGIGIVLKLLALSWAIKVSASVLQPLGEDRICTFLGQIATVLQYAIAIVAASIFLYVVTVLAIISASSTII